MGEWIECAKELPPEKEVVKTKIDDEYGCRNEAKLFRNGRLWYLESGKMYVYYTPTHWRRITRQEMIGMRLISQDGLVDVNYENVGLRIGEEQGVNGVFIYAYSEMMKPTQIAWYSTKDKARQVFEELQKKFLKYASITNHDIGYRAAFDYPKVFQFPRSEDVDVAEDKDHISRKYAIEQMNMAIKDATT